MKKNGMKRIQTLPYSLDLSTGTTSGVNSFLVLTSSGSRSFFTDHHRLPVLCDMTWHIFLRLESSTKYSINLLEDEYEYILMWDYYQIECYEWIFCMERGKGIARVVWLRGLCYFYCELWHIPNISLYY